MVWCLSFIVHHSRRNIITIMSWNPRDILLEYSIFYSYPKGYKGLSSSPPGLFIVAHDQPTNPSACVVFLLARTSSSFRAFSSTLAQAEVRGSYLPRVFATFTATSAKSLLRAGSLGLHPAGLRRLGAFATTSPDGEGSCSLPCKTCRHRTGLRSILPRGC